MEEMKRDILVEKPDLKQMPYIVPEGYFESFKAQAMDSHAKETSMMKRLMPYVSMAAMFLFLLTVGTLFLQKSSSSDEFTHEDFLVFSAYDTEYYDEMYQIADAGIADEDIIEYLIYSGISAEAIELSK